MRTRVAFFQALDAHRDSSDAGAITQAAEPCRELLRLTHLGHV